jgi:hypothetical protein
LGKAQCAPLPVRCATGGGNLPSSRGRLRATRCAVVGVAPLGPHLWRDALAARRGQRAQRLSRRRCVTRCPFSRRLWVGRGAIRPPASRPRPIAPYESWADPIRINRPANYFGGRFPRSSPRLHTVAIRSLQGNRRELGDCLERIKRIGYAAQPPQPGLFCAAASRFGGTGPPVRKDARRICSIRRSV